MADWQRVVDIVIQVQSQGHLFDVILASRARGGTPHLLHRSQHQSHQNADDGDDDQQFEEREGVAIRLRPPASRSAIDSSFDHQNAPGYCHALLALFCEYRLHPETNSCSIQKGRAHIDATRKRKVTSPRGRS